MNKIDMIVGVACLILATLIAIFGIIAPIATFCNSNPGIPVYYAFGFVDEGDYFEEIFLDPLPYWDTEFINVEITGCPSEEDMIACNEIFNEWNTLGNVPILIIDPNKEPDIIINFEMFDDDDVSWAGGTWIKTVDDNNEVITFAHIDIRQSWPYCRENVIRHELGHALGLAYHSNHVTSSIYKYANVYSSYWSEEDLEVIHGIYG